MTVAVLLLKQHSTLCRLLVLSFVVMTIKSHSALAFPDDTCSRAESRLARQIIQESVQPLYAHANLQLPPSCPLSPQRDVYAWHESIKQKLDESDWQCLACGKRFYSQSYLDAHFGRRHPITNHNDSVCLADLCPLLRCSTLFPDLLLNIDSAAPPRRHDGGHSHRASQFWDAALCDESQFANDQHLCQQLLDQCSPPDDPAFAKVREWLNYTLCEHLSCARYWDVPGHWIPASFWDKLSFVATLLIGLAVYYAVLTVHFSDYVSRRVSSLSSPYYFANLKYNNKSDGSDTSNTRKRAD